jgi:hypothetical protein
MFISVWCRNRKTQFGEGATSFSTLLFNKQRWLVSRKYGNHNFGLSIVMLQYLKQNLNNYEQTIILGTSVIVKIHTATLIILITGK